MHVVKRVYATVVSQHTSSTAANMVIPMRLRVLRGNEGLGMISTTPTRQQTEGITHLACANLRYQNIPVVRRGEVSVDDRNKQLMHYWTVSPPSLLTY